VVTGTVLRIDLPELAGPFSAWCHPDYPFIERRSSAWVRTHLAFGFADQRGCDDFVGCLYPLWVCQSYPTAERWRLLRLCNFQQFMFFLDDSDVLLSADPRVPERVLPRLQALLTGDATPQAGLEEAFLAAWQPIAGDMPPPQRRRFVEDLMISCRGSAEEILPRTEERVGPRSGRRARQGRPTAARRPALRAGVHAVQRSDRRAGRAGVEGHRRTGDAHHEH
jgi:hypothetical protein